MTTATLTRPSGTRARAETPELEKRARIRGLRCRSCGRHEPLGPTFVCPACFGPLEVADDHAAIASSVSRSAIAARRPGIWRYLELLPVDAVPAHPLAVGSTPLVDSHHLGAAPPRRRPPLLRPP